MRRNERFLFFKNIITVEMSQVVKREFYIKELQKIETEPEI